MPERPAPTLDMLTGFVGTALSTVDGHWVYYSRPAQITGSYEARRFIEPQTRGNPPAQRHVELFEYHWSYLMAGNRFSDVTSSALRLLLRRPSTVRVGRFGIWWRLWVTAAVVLVMAVITVAVA
jgi:hypothetical protein